jgi:hypothetical protein
MRRKRSKGQQRLHGSGEAARASDRVVRMHAPDTLRSLSSLAAKHPQFPDSRGEGLTKSGGHGSSAVGGWESCDEVYERAGEEAGRVRGVEVEKELSEAERANQRQEEIHFASHRSEWFSRLLGTIVALSRAATRRKKYEVQVFVILQPASPPLLPSSAHSRPAQPRAGAGEMAVMFSPLRSSRPVQRDQNPSVTLRQ